MNVSLSKQQQEMVESLVREGRYNNTSEVIRAGLRLLEKDELALESPDLEKQLLESLREPARPMPNDYCARIRDKAKARLRKRA